MVVVFAFKMKTNSDVSCSVTTMAANSAPPSSKRMMRLNIGGHEVPGSISGYSVLIGFEILAV